MARSDFKSGYPLTDRIAQQLRHDIINGTIPAGTKITVAGMAEEFGVSGSPVREAFRMLASDGLLISDAYKGNTVAQVDKNFIKSIYDTVNALEIPLALDAMKKFTDENIQELRAINDRMRITGDHSEFVALNQLFHAHINELSDNEIAKRIMRTYLPMLHSFRGALPPFGDDRNSVVVKEHEQIIAALENREEESLRKILRIHSERSSEYALASFEKYR